MFRPRFYPIRYRAVHSASAYKLRLLRYRLENRLQPAAHAIWRRAHWVVGAAFAIFTLAVSGSALAEPSPDHSTTVARWVVIPTIAVSAVLMTALVALVRESDLRRSRT